MSHIRKVGKNYSIEFNWNDKRYHRSLGVSNREYARKMQQKLDYQISNGEFNPARFFGKADDVMTLSQLREKLARHLDAHSGDYTQRTIQTYLYNFDELIKIIGDVELEKVNPGVVEDVEIYLNRDYSHATRRQRLATFRLVFNKAKEWGYILINPFIGKVPKKLKTKPQFLTEEEIERMRDYFSDKTPWLYDMIFLTVNTGLRRREVSDLTWENVDLPNEQLKIYGKGRKERFVPLNRQAVDIIKNRQKQIHITGKLFWETPNPYNAISLAWGRFRNALNKQREKNAQPKFRKRFHDLRATYASWYLMNGGSIERLSKILGHSSIVITEEAYGDFSRESLHKDKNIVAF